MSTNSSVRRNKFIMPQTRIWPDVHKKLQIEFQEIYVVLKDQIVKSINTRILHSNLVAVRRWKKKLTNFHGIYIKRLMSQYSKFPISKCSSCVVVPNFRNFDFKTSEF